MQNRTDNFRSSVDDQYLVFTLNDKKYGVDLIKVQEIKEWEEPTEVLGAPKEMRGLLNLRGVVVPVVDMRIRFDMGEANFTRETVIIVTYISGKKVGLVVDSVSDVVTLSEGQFKKSPKVDGFAADHIKGVATLEDGMVILLNTERMLSKAVLEVGC